MRVRMESRLDNKQLGEHLFRVAEQRAASVGRHLGEGADHDLSALTQRGADELLKQGDEVERLKQIRLAEVNLTRLIDMAVEGAMLLENYPVDLLGERSYFP